MAIIFDEAKKTFKLDTLSSSYIFKIYKENFLVHLYYGAKIPDNDLPDYEKRPEYASFSARNARLVNDDFTADTYPLEIGCNGTGDNRTSALQIRSHDGTASTDVRYVSHKIYGGKPKLKGLPAFYANDEEECQTLEVVTLDKTTGAEVTLIYTVFEKYSAMTRSVIVKNTSDKPFSIERVMSFCLDLPTCDYEMLSLYGRHNKERTLQKRPLSHGSQYVGSKRGTSSHQYNPFIALKKTDTTEDSGEVIGFSLVYSCNFIAEAEVDYNGSTRVVMGINPFDFAWKLDSGESFYSPEAMLVFSSEGMGEMSRTYHRVINNNLVRGKWKNAKRPLLINNWEGTGFNFDDEKIYTIASQARELGVEMLVMDDGWFGKRDDDRSGLGDWVTNEKKLKGGLSSLVKRVNGLGMKFGIWFEPEMISPDSDLYRAHPDWCIHVNGRENSVGRWQYVLDMTRADVRESIFGMMSKILSENNIEYIKWDFNRNITEAGSAELTPEHQKEFFHRYILGTYELMDRIVDAFPHLLFENCSGGGGRYDAGMMYYSPQIWCSDNTDSLSRLDIQFGSSLCYPASVQGAHVSANGRTSYTTKANVAMWGTFGYELDTKVLDEETKELVKQQIADYHKYYDLIHFGDLYRIISTWDNPYRCAWEFVSPDKKQAMLTVVTKFHMEGTNFFVRLKGLNQEKTYRCCESSEEYSGARLMNAGLNLTYMPNGDGDSFVLHFAAAE